MSIETLAAWIIILRFALAIIVAVTKAIYAELEKQAGINKR